MSTANEQAATPATDTATPAVPAAPVIPSAAPSDQEPNWLPERLKRAKESAQKETLAALGIDDIEKAKVALKAAKDAEEARKGEIEKLTEKQAALAIEAKKAAEYGEKLTKYADAELAKLSDNQRAAVLALIGEDKHRALETIEALRPTWPTKPEAKAEPDAEAKAPRAAPATTTASTAAPAATNTSPPNHKATYEGLKASGKTDANAEYEARMYALAHPEVFK